MAEEPRNRTGTSLDSRLDAVERALSALAAELADVRELVSATPAAGQAPARAAVEPPPDRLLRRPASSAPAVAQARDRIWAGDPAGALARLERGIGEATSAHVLLEIAGELDEIAAAHPQHSGTADLLAAKARRRGQSLHPAPATVPPTPQPPSVGSPRREPSPSLAELAARWEIVGPRGFAIAGGAVTALGVVLLFVLAANRGWIGPAERVAIGAVASGLVFAAGLVLRARLGQYAASLGAVGAGIAGGYATLAAAAALYDLVPDGLALALAALIAAAATAVSLRWSSEIVAGLGLVGSALAPALEALDSGLTAGSVAFAVVVLGAAGAVVVLRNWQRLLAVVALVVGGQALALVAQADAPGDPATIAVAGSLTLVTLVVACSLQLARGRRELEPLALSLLLAAAGFALVAGAMLFAVGPDRGIALAVAGAVWAGAWVALRGRQPDLGLVTGASALALASVATADLISDDALTLAWAAEAILFAALASRLRDARLTTMGLGYVALAAGHALVVSAPPRLLFDPADADPAAALAPAAAALAAAIAGAVLPLSYAGTGERGALAWLADLRAALSGVRRPLQESLGFGAAAVGTYAAAVLLVGVSFEGGHLAASGIAAAVAAGSVAIAARRRSTGLVVAGLAALAVVLVEAVGFDVDEFLDADDRSVGGWSVLEAAAGALAGGIALRVLHPTERRLGIASGVAASIALLCANLGLAFVVPTDGEGDPARGALGIGIGLVALAYMTAAAAVFRAERLRNLSTTLWILGGLALLESEGILISDARATAFAFALTGGTLAVVAPLAGEVRLWLAGAVVVAATSLWTLGAVTTPANFLEASTTPADGLWVLAGCTAALVALAATARAHGFATAAAAAGLALFGVSLGLLELAVRVSGASVETDFERGHTAVSAVWALLGLGLLVVGLLRSAPSLRTGGLALFGVSLAKIFLYDLSELSSVARALSFLAVGALLLAGGFFLQRLSEHLGPRHGAPV